MTAPREELDEPNHDGIDFALEQLCTVLGVDPHMVSWDAATETVDGDVRAVIGNIMCAKYGEDFDPRASAAQGLPTPEQIEPILDDFLGVDSPHYEELRRRCAQRIFELCAVKSGLPITPSNSKITPPDSSTDQREGGK